MKCVHRMSAIFCFFLFFGRYNFKIRISIIYERYKVCLSNLQVNKLLLIWLKETRKPNLKQNKNNLVLNTKIQEKMQRERYSTCNFRQEFFSPLDSLDKTSKHTMFRYEYCYRKL